MTIAQVSKAHDISADTLRYYERIGLIPTVGRTQGGIRDYNETDCKWVEFIKCMRRAGLPIEVLIEYVMLFREGDSTVPARINLLTEQRDLLSARIDEMHGMLTKLNTKIERYEQTVGKAEKSLTIK